ncbi:MAG: hypothetical protein IPF54_07860 [Draconibacterium sp.]|nr:hypothetical protein [Draconibacterium sp.]
MLVEYVVNPVNIDNNNPRFSWIVESSERNQNQSAYRILSQPIENCWQVKKPILGFR